jgi:hypothetical protein
VRTPTISPVVALLVDDPLGAAREAADGDLTPYRRAFDLVDGDPAHLLLAAVDGGRRRRDAGPGTAMIGWAGHESRPSGVRPGAAGHRQEPRTPVPPRLGP